MVENQQAGTDAWLSSKLGDDVNGQIKGYASANSVAPGDGLTFYVSVNPVQTYTIEVYRLGWYGGLGGRLRLSAGPLDGIQQPACPVDATTGLIACAWTAGLSVTVPNGPTRFAGAPSAFGFHDAQIQPFIGYIFTRDRWYIQGFEAIDVPTCRCQDLRNGNAFPILATNALGWFAGGRGELREALATGATTEVNLPTGHDVEFRLRSPDGQTR